jgi:hypothetical protein
MKPAKLTKINTTGGQKYLITTYSTSKTFKTEAGARKWAERHGYCVNSELNGDE